MTLTIIRGLPGSGKTTLAMKLSTSCEPYFEADQYFTDKDGNYEFSSRKLTEAHNWCREKVGECLLAGEDCIVSNTFTRYWELLPYLLLAIQCGADLQVIDCYGTWDSVHGVPDDVLTSMKNRWMPYTDVLTTIEELRKQRMLEMRHESN